MSIQTSAIDIARGEVGYVEGKRNHTKYADEMEREVQNAAWCGTFVTWCYAKAGLDLRPHVWLYYVPFAVTWAKKLGAWKSADAKGTRAQPGDMVVYDFGKTGRYRHIGIAWPDEKAQGYRAIEGNTSATSAGSQANGGQVALRYRGRASIAGWIDMATVLKRLGVSQPSTQRAAVPQGAVSSGELALTRVLDKATALEMQERLKTFDASIELDGVFGPASIKTLQRYLGHPVHDGLLDGLSDLAIRTLQAVRKDCLKRGTRGSLTGRKLQAYCGLTGRDLDGNPGPASIEQLQRMLNAFPVFLTTADRDMALSRIAAARL